MFAKRVRECIRSSFLVSDYSSSDDSHTPSLLSTTSFPRFRELSQEIRGYVWKYALTIPDRVVSLRLKCVTAKGRHVFDEKHVDQIILGGSLEHEGYLNAEDLLRQKYIEGLGSVSREARAAMTRLYPNTIIVGFLKKTWHCNFETDIFFLDLSPWYAWEFRRDTEYLGLCLTYISKYPNWAPKSSAIRKFLASIRNVMVTPDRSFLHGGSTYHLLPSRHYEILLPAVHGMRCLYILLKSNIEGPRTIHIGQAATLSFSIDRSNDGRKLFCHGTTRGPRVLSFDTDPKANHPCRMLSARLFRISPTQFFDKA